MVQGNEQVERLARELAGLDPADQARVIAGAERLRRGKPTAQRFTIPKLSGGDAWTGSDLRRETLYGDDGR